MDKKSRGYELESTPPALPCTPLAACDVFYDPQLTAWLQFRGLDVASKFSFLNLGLLAYLGGEYTQVMLLIIITKNLIQTSDW